MDHAYEVSKIEQSAPFLVFTGVAGDENACTVIHLLWAVWQNIDAIVNLLEPKPIRAELHFLGKQVSCNILNCTGKMCNPPKI